MLVKNNETIPVNHKILFSFKQTEIRIKFLEEGGEKEKRKKNKKNKNK